MIRFYCQICGERFETGQREQRFCSDACRYAFNESRPGRYATPVKTQAAILNVLRQSPGTWVKRRDIALTIYGRSEKAELRAVTVAVYRMRHNWSSEGLVVTSHTDHARLESDAETYYRLDQDIATPLRQAS